MPLFVQVTHEEVQWYPSFHWAFPLCFVQESSVWYVRKNALPQKFSCDKKQITSEAKVMYNSRLVLVFMHGYLDLGPFFKGFGLVMVLNSFLHSLDLSPKPIFTWSGVNMGLGIESFF